MTAFVYRCFDATGQLLYVGCSNDPQSRLNDHRRSKSWWPDVARTQTVAYPSRDQALDAEALAIRAETPLHNVYGAGRRRREVSAIYRRPAGRHARTRWKSNLCVCGTRECESAA